jgi:rhodanese-related sulfurtransferase
LGGNQRRLLISFGVLLFAVVIILILLSTGGGDGGNSADTLPAFVSVDEAYQMYEEGTFVLDVRTPEEWEEYHAPDTTLIPLDELASRVNELPKDQPIVVICRSGNRSQTGRDILLQAGFNATSTTGGLNAWRDSGYPVVSGP